jgi:hypothetical protein
MKCEFNINDDLLEMKITVPKKKSANDARVRVGRNTALRLANDYKCPKDTLLGECLTPNKSLDNFTNDRLEDVWLFKLEKLHIKKSLAKPVKRKTSARPPARPKRNKTEGV